MHWYSVCRFKSLSYYRHLAASPSFGRADSSGVAFRRRQLSALQTMDMPLDGDKYGWLLNLQTLANTWFTQADLQKQCWFQKIEIYLLRDWQQLVYIWGLKIKKLEKWRWQRERQYVLKIVKLLDNRHIVERENLWKMWLRADRV